MEKKFENNILENQNFLLIILKIFGNITSLLYLLENNNKNNENLINKRIVLLKIIIGINFYF